MDYSGVLDSDLSAYTVLVVDDIALNLLMVQKMLSRFSFKIIVAHNGQEAIEKIAQDKPVLVLLDLMMPVMDGYEVISRVRSNPDYNSTRIVVLSALNTNDNIVKAISMGADEFITKPIAMEKLFGSVAREFDMILAMEADSKH